MDDIIWYVGGLLAAFYLGSRWGYYRLCWSLYKAWQLGTIEFHTKEFEEILKKGGKR